MALKQANIITVTSVKGGTGKTTTVLNLAGILSKRNKKVLIIDLDLYASAVAISLGLGNEVDLFRLVDDLKNNSFTNIDNYISKYNENISVLPAPKDPRMANKIGNKYFQLVLSKLKPKFDYIIIDTNHIIDDFNLVSMDYSDTILYLITNDPVDLKNMRSMVSIYNDMDKTNYKVILNNSVNKQKDYFTEYDIKHIIHNNIDYIIPESFYIKTADKFVMDGKIMSLDPKVRRTNKKGIAVLEKIIDSIIAENEEGKPVGLEVKIGNPEETKK